MAITETTAMAARWRTEDLRAICGKVVRVFRCERWKIVLFSRDL